MRIALLLSFVLLMGVAQGQSCHGVVTKGEATAEFAALGQQKEFKNAHELPAARENAPNLQGEMISFEVPQGAPGNAYLVKANTNTNKYLLVYQEWWGLNEHIKSEADRLSKALEGNAHVLAIDLYDGKVATTRNAAAELMGMAKQERCEALIKAAMAYAGEEAQFASIGWCFGGGWSIQSAILAGERSWGCVMYYGMPEKDIARLKKLNTKVLAIYAKQDQWITEKVAKEFEANMEKAGKEVTSLHYDANHAFCNPSGQRYDEEAAQAANAKALSYLKERVAN